MYNSLRFYLKFITDIEADPDDTQSLVRLLLYSNQIDIKGMIATTCCWHTSEVNPGSIKMVIEGYSKVRLNLLKHESGFPELHLYRCL